MAQDVAETKKFRTYYEEDEWGDKRKKDRKRYDKKRASVQQARKQKKNLKTSYIDT